MIDIVETKRGVGVLIVNGDRFLTIEERDLDETTQKVPGMRSLIYETIENGETEQQALIRALSEEVNLDGILPDGFLTNVKLCLVQINTGVWLHAYLVPIKIPEDFVISEGISKDAYKPGWDLIDSVLREKIGSTRFRPGNREVISSYLKYGQGLLGQPEVFFETQDKIPSHHFTKDS